MTELKLTMELPQKITSRRGIDYNLVENQHSNGVNLVAYLKAEGKPRCYPRSRMIKINADGTETDWNQKMYQLLDKVGLYH